MNELIMKLILWDWFIKFLIQIYILLSRKNCLKECSISEYSYQVLTVILKADTEIQILTLPTLFYQPTAETKNSLTWTQTNMWPFLLLDHS